MAGVEQTIERRPTGALARYVSELGEKTARHRAEFDATDSSALLFRLGVENFALPTISVREVLNFPVIHSVPRAANPAILGLANVRGELLLCASLNKLLRMPDSKPTDEEAKRLLVLAWRGTHLGCPVEEVIGVRRFVKETLRPAPPGVDMSDGLVLGILETPEHLASVLSVDALFSELSEDSAA